MIASSDNFGGTTEYRRGRRNANTRSSSVRDPRTRARDHHAERSADIRPRPAQHALDEGLLIGRHRFVRCRARDPSPAKIGHRLPHLLDGRRLRLPCLGRNHDHRCSQAGSDETCDDQLETHPAPLFAVRCERPRHANHTATLGLGVEGSLFTRPDVTTKMGSHEAHEAADPRRRGNGERSHQSGCHAGAARSGGRRIARRPIASRDRFLCGLVIGTPRYPSEAKPPAWSLRAFRVSVAHQFRVLRVLRELRVSMR